VAFWSLPHPLLSPTRERLSNVQAAKARGRRVVAVGANGDEALRAGRDVKQPRNLAKPVTAE